MITVIKHKERVNKVISVFLVYSISLNYILPFAKVYDEFGDSAYQKLSSGWSFELDSNEIQATYELKETPNISETLDKQETIEKSVTSYSNSASTSSGTGQPETSGFTMNTGGMIVDEFTGDLTYSIPLADVEGFPITISYNPNISMDQEASWVGLGWNLSLGSINRDMRGIPDDFSGDNVTRTVKTKDETKAGSSFGMDFFMSVGISDFINFGGGLHVADGGYFSNYSGLGNTHEFGLYTSVGLLGIVSGQASVGVTTDDQNGVGYTRSLGYDFTLGAMGSSFGGYQDHRSNTLHSRSGIQTKSKTSGWSKGVNIFGYGYIESSLHSSYRNFGVQTYVPRFTVPTKGYNTYYRNSGAGIGGIAFISGGLGMSKTEYSDFKTMVGIVQTYPAYGFNNISRGHKDSRAMLDFNRSGSNIVNSESKNLSFSAPTFDLFYCSAPGFNSSFRSYRHDAYELHDPTVTNFTLLGGGSESNTGIIIFPSNIGWQGGPGNTVGAIVSKTGEATTNLINLTAKDGGSNRDGKEYYFRSLGEQSLNQNTLINQYEGLQPSRINMTFGITSDNVTIDATNIISTNGSLSNLPTNNFDLTRPNNAVHYKQYTIKDLKSQALQNYDLFDCSREVYKVVLPSTDLIIANSDLKQDHHLGAVEVVNPDGMRYVFGIPSYNYLQSEVTFSVSRLPGETDATYANESDYLETGMMQYKAGDNSVNNQRGRQAMYDKTETPAYATTFLLTELYSSDYIDRKNDGPSADDLGNYYKINYSNLYGENSPYQWRMPMCSDVETGNIEDVTRLAYFNKNYYTDQWDDMAHYTFGKKDVFYAASLESKNYIAYFCLEDRQDQFSMKTEDGGLDLTKPGKLLKKIVIYSKNDIKISNGSARPLQIIEFDYDYSLCKNYVGNSDTYIAGPDSGKLTLKAIYSYSGKSSESKTIPIEFEYNDFNPDFKFNSTDRWGNYKPNDISLPNHEFPYSDQSAEATVNIQAWKLTKVKQTTGAEMELNYGTDSYAFVQDKRAMRMFSIIGMSNKDILVDLADIAVGDQVTMENYGVTNSFRGGENEDHYNVIYFKLDETISGTKPEATQKVIDQYFRNEKGNIPDEFYFRMFTQLGNRSSIDQYEFVESSAKLDKLYNSGNYIGVVGNGNEYEYGYVILEPEELNEYADNSAIEFLNKILEFLQSLPGINFPFGPLYSYKVNPLAVSNWQYGRLNVPCSVYGDIDYNALVPTDFCDYHLSNDWNLMGFNLYKRLNKKKYGLYFYPNKSMIKLYEPDNVKYGGNSKIVSVTIRDGWDDLTGEFESTYKWSYDYLNELRSGTTGVASYEPIIGNNENVFYVLDGYSYEKIKLPDEKMYTISPFGELVYPNPIVGYSRLRSNILNLDGAVGNTTNYFYTLKDFPTKSAKTSALKVDLTGENAIERNKIFFEVLGISQGFYVETSDYHGKPKRFETRDIQGNLISSSTFNYYDHEQDLMKYSDEEGNITLAKTPRDIDIYADSWRYKETNSSVDFIKTTSAGVKSLVFPYYNQKNSANLNAHITEAMAVTFSKVMHHSAILKSVETSYLGSENISENLVYDAESGNVILSYLKDEFQDNLYSLNYPAHWKYSTFENIAINDENTFKSGTISEVTVGTNHIVQNNSTNGASFHVGDELEIDDQGVLSSAWVLKIDGNSVYLIDNAGLPINGVTWASTKVKVVRSGRKNNLNASMMNLSTKENPLSGNSLNFPTSEVIEVSAFRYKENKNLPCIPQEYFGLPIALPYSNRQYFPEDVVNPFLKGVMGNYRLSSSFVFQSGRSIGDILGIRKDGKLLNYEPFYALNSGAWYSIDEPSHPNYSSGDYQDWREMGTIDQYDEFGKRLQSTNQIDVSSAVLYGMNKDLKLVPKAVAVNAKLNEIGFDGFEDHNYFTDNQIFYLDHGFSLSPDGITAQIVNTQRHSGEYSMQVNEETSFRFNTDELPSVETEHINVDRYEVQECDCIRTFAPTRTAEYFLSAWVKEDTRIYPYVNARVKVRFLDQGGVQLSEVIFSPQGSVIDGWQKIEGRYTIPLTAAKVEYLFYSDDNASVIFVDDFRTHPFTAEMNSVVYDQRTLQTIATHDGYNYTTFYNYDENFQLVRTRLETVDGIQTVSEIESGSRRK